MKSHSALRTWTGRCLAGCLTFSVLTAAENPASAPPSKPYVLFMGADLDVQREKKLHRVEDVVGSELKIRIGKKEFFVPTRNRQTALKVSHSLKLSGATVQLDNLEGGPSYTPANDPVRKMIAASGAAGGAAAVQDLAYGRMIQASLLATQASMSANAGGSAEAQGAAVAAERSYQEALAQAGAMSSMIQTSSQYNTGAYVDQMQKELAEGNYDAMDVSFKISSPVELDDPYMVVLFKFREREAKPGEESMIIHAEALDAIGSKPKYIRVRKGGLPRGFKYLDSEVHIFNRGREVATNASSKRVELTREEAQQYLVIEHMGANKDATLPAIAISGSLPPGRLKALSLDQINRTYYVKVAPDGSAAGLYSDESCNLAIDDGEVRTIVGDVFFKPALVKGKPVEGVARVRLGEI